jgi:hypothetical protein
MAGQENQGENLGSFGKLRPTFDEIKSRSSMNPNMVNHEPKKGLYFFKMTKPRLGLINRAV